MRGKSLTCREPPLGLIVFDHHIRVRDRPIINDTRQVRDSPRTGGPSPHVCGLRFTHLLCDFVDRPGREIAFVPLPRRAHKCAL
jgi:hypothetical protein